MTELFLGLTTIDLKKEIISDYQRELQHCWEFHSRLKGYPLSYYDYNPVYKAITLHDSLQHINRIYKQIDKLQSQLIN